MYTGACSPRQILKTYSQGLWLHTLRIPRPGNHTLECSSHLLEKMPAILRTPETLKACFRIFAPCSSKEQVSSLRITVSHNAFVAPNSKCEPCTCTLRSQEVGHYGRTATHHNVTGTSADEVAVQFVKWRNFSRRSMHVEAVAAQIRIMRR